MIDLQSKAVAGWLNAIQPARTDTDWPPAIRPIENALDLPMLFDELSQVLDLHESNDQERLAAAVSDPETIVLLRTVLAQLGAARMLRIVSALSDQLTDGECAAVLHRGLRDKTTHEGRALAAALDATARTTLRGRLAAQDRLNALRHALEQTSEETP